MKNILVSGGAGYIGSHTARALVQQGYQAVVLDSLVTGHRQAIGRDMPFYQGDIADAALVKKIIVKEKISSVIHFAARSLVGESIRKPDLYFIENTAKTNFFLSTLLSEGVGEIVFSSTAAVYGIPEAIPIAEDTDLAPINPYGVSKLMIEQSLAWLGKAYGLKWISLRYFNAVGDSLDGALGEDHHPETHLIPLVLQTALGQRDCLDIYGTDYATPDGTCIRDYIHVLDLANAHIHALQALARGMANEIYNVGTGRGYSVREVIETARQITGRPIPCRESPRRQGDPGRLVAKVEKIREHLGWQPQYSSLEQILESAWSWHRTHPNGYNTKKAIR